MLAMPRLPAVMATRLTRLDLSGEIQAGKLRVDFPGHVRDLGTIERLADAEYAGELRATEIERAGLHG